MSDALVYIGMGSSEGDRVAILREAVGRIHEHAEVTRVSRLYDTRPVGGARRPFVNAALELRTRADLAALLEQLLTIEVRLGRIRDADSPTTTRDRTLDLDILLAFEASPRLAVTVETPGLRVPHPRVAARDFVLAPLCDLEPALPLPGGSTVARALAVLPDADRTIVGTRVDVISPVSPRAIVR